MKTAFALLLATIAFSTWMVEDALKFQYSKGPTTIQIVQAAEVTPKAPNLPAEVIIAPPMVIIRPR